MKVSIEDIKKLRVETGAGVSDCRQALKETGDYKAAEEWLRKKGIEKAAKKSEREVKAGRVFSYAHHTGRLGSMVAVACETDFVAKTDDFQKLGKELALQVASTQPESVEILLDQEYIRDPGKKIGDLIKEVIGKLGENIQVIEFKVVSV
ncbi:MAG: elongation factor T [Microgenomates group bacterium Gr01-1014_16]|nr:MAG: elongation factor T [Microgenomates group bacterium Gr01-1014_16]